MPGRSFLISHFVEPFHRCRARRNDVNENTAITTATKNAVATSQRAPSRVHARNALCTQANANTANTAPTTS
jgi:hypothetical protein